LFKVPAAVVRTAMLKFPSALALVLACWLWGGSRTQAALPWHSPEAFFTNVADRLLEQQLGLRLAEIQIAPTNQYDAAVHRVLQVTANVFDATSTNEFPSVFRPRFTTNGGAVFLAGFTYDNRASTLPEWLASNPYRVPLVIAARKGFPAFNEFVLRTDVVTQRKLQFTRPDIAPGTRPNGTNQMYTLTLSNFFGVEAWNPYDVQRGALPYPRPLLIQVTNFARISLTNNLGLQTNDAQSAAASMVIPANAWQGGLQPGTNTFRLLLTTNMVSLRNAPYRFTDNVFGGSTNAFEIHPGFPIPQSEIVVSNALTYLAQDGDNIVDCTLLDGVAVVDLHRDLWTVNPYAGIGGVSATISDLWRTNRFNPSGPTMGIRTQVDIARGNLPISLVEWREFGLVGAITENDKRAAIDGFRYFCGLAPIYGVPFVTNDTLAMNTPFNPAAKMSTINTWAMNDPLVRYPIRTPGLWTNHFYLKPLQTASNIAPATFGYLNNNYAPWNGNPHSASYPEFSNRAIQDAGVYSADQWNFPTNETPAAHWLGRVHRGTPWQTIYLQADIAPTSQWMKQSSDAMFVPGLGIVSRTHPTNDWRLATLLASWMNTNDVRALHSVNSTNLGAWAAKLDGVFVLSNNLFFPIFMDPMQFESIVLSSNSPQASVVAEGIQRTRRAQRGQYFADVGAFLAVPELSSAAPWLNLSSQDQLMFGLNDEAYEALPAQFLSLVRADPVVSTTRVVGGAVLSVTAYDGYTYRVESSTNLTTWTTFNEPYHPTNGVFTLTVPASSGPQFFRAVLTGPQGGNFEP
jgi:hypothetical protein